MNRRDFLVMPGLAAIAASLAARSAPAQPAPAFPTRPVHLVVPFQAGGSADALARLVAQKMQPTWPQPVIVENRPGGGGVIGVQALLHAPPDGHTLMIAAVQSILRPLLFPDTPYRPFADLAPVTRLGSSQIAFVVRADAPATSMQHFIEAGNRSSEPLSFGSSGAGTVVHLYGELIRKKYLPQLIIAQMGGDAQILPAVLGGQVSCALMALPSVTPQVQGGRLRALAITGTARAPQLPNVPTFKEAGLPGMEGGYWYGLFAAGGTPAATVTRIQSDLHRTLAADQDFAERMAVFGTLPELGPPDEFTDSLQRESKKWADVIAATGVRIEE